MPAAAMAFAVPPVETSSTFMAASSAASPASPALSETEIKARRTGTRSGGAIFLEATAIGKAPGQQGDGCA